MNLIEKIKQEDEKAHDKWFERWFAGMNLENQILQSVGKGYSSRSIELKKYNRSGDDDYLNRRLRDPRTIEKLQEKLPDINIEFEEKEYKNILGYISKDERIIFSWKE